MSLILLFKSGREKNFSLLAEEENIVSIQLHTEFIKNEQASELSPLRLTWPHF